MKYVVGMVGSLLTMTCGAFEEPLRVEGQSFSAEVNYLLSTSQSDDADDVKNQNLSGSWTYQRKDNQWGQSYYFEGVSSSSDGSPQSNIERYLFAAKAMRFLSSDSDYLFGRFQGEKDINSGFDYTLTPTFGYGKQIFSTPDKKLNTEIGVGGQYIKSDSDNEFVPVATVGAAYQHAFNEAVTFEQELDYEFATSLKTLRTTSRLLAELSSSISGVVSYKIKQVDADEGDSRDTLTAIGIRYNHN